MTMSFDRRTFVAASAATGTAAVCGGLVQAMLREPEAASRVFAILKAELHLQEGHRGVVQAFVHSLATTTQHHESPQAFAAKLTPEQGEDLSRYVVQEFVVSTNYLAYVAGRTNDLALIKA